MTTRPRLSLKVSYSVPEMAELLGKPERTTLRLLRRLGILRQPGGPRTHGIVYLGDLRRMEPALWESLLDYDAAVAREVPPVASAEPEPDVDSPPRAEQPAT